jgi:hypothetical protein
MRSFRSAALVLVMMGAAHAAPPYPPPPTYTPPSPPLTPPPPLPLPPPRAFMPPPAEVIVALEQSAHRKLIAGDLLLVTGGALALTGTGLLIADASIDSHCTNDGRFRGARHDVFCPTAFGISGVLTLSAGVAALIPGAILRSQGARELVRARWLRRGPPCCPWTLGPRVGLRSAVAELTIRL